MAGDQRRSVIVQCVEVASVAISGKEEAKQAGQWEVDYKILWVKIGTEGLVTEGLVITCVCFVKCTNFPWIVKFTNTKFT